MKKIIYTAAIATLAIISTAKAQVSIGVSIGTPAPVYVAPAPVASGPYWVPAGASSPYYYFPDINCYYDMNIGQYIYMQNNAWIYSRSIPPRFARYNFRRARMMPLSNNAFAYRRIPAYRGGGRQMMVNNNYYSNRGRGPQNWNNMHRDNGHNQFGNGGRPEGRGGRDNNGRRGGR